MSTGGGGLDAVARGRRRVAPADQSSTGSAVMIGRHVGGRTRGWENKEVKTAQPFSNKIVNVGCHGKFSSPVSFSVGLLISLMHTLLCPTTAKV